MWIAAIALHLSVHEIRTAREMGWDKLQNGVLLRAAADAGFDVFLSLDKKLEHEQKLTSLPLPVVVIDKYSSALPKLIPFAPALLSLLGSPLDKVLHIAQNDGKILKLSAPR